MKHQKFIAVMSCAFAFWATPATAGFLVQDLYPGGYDGIGSNDIWHFNGNATVNIPVCWAWSNQSSPPPWATATENFRNSAYATSLRELVRQYESHTLLVFPEVWGKCPTAEEGGSLLSNKGIILTVMSGDVAHAEARKQVTPSSPSQARVAIRAPEDPITLKDLAQTAMHEFGHALGFDHEHNRPDKVNCLSNDEPNIVSRVRVMAGPYDDKSIMNYCSYVWRDANTPIPGFRNPNLTENDIISLKYYYDRVPKFSLADNTLVIPVINFNNQKFRAKMVLGSDNLFTLTEWTPISGAEAVSKSEVNTQGNNYIFPLLFLEEYVSYGGKTFKKVSSATGAILYPVGTKFGYSLP